MTQNGIIFNFSFNRISRWCESRNEGERWSQRSWTYTIWWLGEEGTLYWFLVCPVKNIQMYLFEQLNVINTTAYRYKKIISGPEMCKCFLMGLLCRMNSLCKSSLNYLNSSVQHLIDILKRICYWESNVFILFETGLQSLQGLKDLFKE